MNKALEAAIKKWNAEVEDEAVKLIERGVPPFDATAVANRRISDRRRGAHDKKRKKTK